MLRSAGHVVFAPTLTGFGERVHLTRADLTIEDFAADILNVIAAEELNDIILVGHSFGGNPVSVVADRVPERLKHLVLLSLREHIVTFDSLFSVARFVFLARKLTAARG